MYDQNNVIVLLTNTLEPSVVFGKFRTFMHMEYTKQEDKKMELTVKKPRCTFIKGLLRVSTPYIPSQGVVALYIINRVAHGQAIASKQYPRI